MLSKIEMVEIDINGYKYVIFNSRKNKTKFYKFYLNEIVKPAVWLRRSQGYRGPLSLQNLMDFVITSK